MPHSVLHIFSQIFRPSHVLSRQSLPASSWLWQRKYFKTYTSVLQTLLTGGMPLSRHKAYSLHHNASLKEPELRNTKSFTRVLTNKSQTELVSAQQNQLSFSAWRGNAVTRNCPLEGSQNQASHPGVTAYCKMKKRISMTPLNLFPQS